MPSNQHCTVKAGAVPIIHRIAGERSPEALECGLASHGMHSELRTDKARVVSQRE